MEANQFLLIDPFQAHMLLLYHSTVFVIYVSELI